MVKQSIHIQTNEHRLTAPSNIQRQPSKIPAFTLTDIRNAIPSECFERPLWKSFGYLFWDLMWVSILFFLSLTFKYIALKSSTFLVESFGGNSDVLATMMADSKLYNSSMPTSFSQLSTMFGESSSAFVKAFSTNLFTSGAGVAIYSLILIALWTGYIIVQGAVMTGLWVIGHECGHGGFSSSRAICDAVGLVIHSALFVPYYSWQISHRRHHSHTGDMEKDEVHMPTHINALLPSASYGYLHNDQYDEQVKTCKEGKPVNGTGNWVRCSISFAKEVASTLRQFNVFFRAISFIGTTILGWFLYLSINASGRRYPDKKKFLPVTHFDPSSPIFSKSEYVSVVVSNIVLGMYVYLYYRISQAYGFSFYLMSFLLPYMVVQYWLVVITLLQHTHVALPHYSSEAWTFVRGALATVDRDFGPFYNFVLHNINDTHVMHHLISNIPHYHAEKATKAVLPLLGDYYIKTYHEREVFGVINSLWIAIRECNFIAEDEHPALAQLETHLNSHKKKSDTSSMLALNKATASPSLTPLRDKAKEVYWFRTIV